jgi:hypothetical protein
LIEIGKPNFPQMHGLAITIPSSVDSFLYMYLFYSDLKAFRFYACLQISYFESNSNDKKLCCRVDYITLELTPYELLFNCRSRG